VIQLFGQTRKMRIFKNCETAAPGEMREMILTAEMPSPVQQIASKELETLSKISSSAAEYAIGLNYVGRSLSLSRTEDNLELARVSRILNEWHYGPNKIKEKVVLPSL